MSYIRGPVKHREKLHIYKLVGNEISLITSPGSIELVIYNTYLNEHQCGSIKLDLKQ